MSAKTDEQPVLVSPEGKEWTPEDAVQATNLRARGWAEKPAAKTNKTSTASS